MSAPAVTNSASQIPMIELYTGTEDHPDVVSIFLNSADQSGTIKRVDEEITNSFGHSPVYFYLAIPRIVKAVKIMFNELSACTLFNPNSEFWNAFKNFTRGIVQLVPLIGNAILYVYDELRKVLFIQPKIKAAMAGTQQPMVGIAFDGKVLFSIPLDTVKNRLSPNTDLNEQGILSLVKYTWCSLKQNALTIHSPITDRGLAEQLLNLINQRP
jgi:hypothetical protein